VKEKNVGRIEKYGGEELKNAFDMIHEQGYSLCYKFFLLKGRAQCGAYV